MQERRDVIQKLLRNLPLTADTDDNLSRALDALTEVVGSHGPARRPNAFNQGTTQTRDSELKKLKRLGEVADLLDGLHGATINVLARGGGACDLVGLADKLRKVAIAASTGELPALPMSGRGAPKKQRAEGITKVAASHYRILTGREPTYSKPTDTSRRRAPYGPWHDFLDALFKLAEVKASVVVQTDKLRPIKSSKTG